MLYVTLPGDFFTTKNTNSCQTEGMRWQALWVLVTLVACTESPGVSYTPADYQVALEAVNGARTQAQTCTSKSYPAAPPLVWNGLLGEVARARAEHIQQTGEFSHYEGGSSKPAVEIRARQVGYRYRALGENLARGYAEAREAVSAWLGSTQGHCDLLMNPQFTEMGMVQRGEYWVLVVGQPAP